MRLSIAVTSTFRVLYVLVVIEHHSRRLIHSTLEPGVPDPSATPSMPLQKS